MEGGDERVDVGTERGNRDRQIGGVRPGKGVGGEPTEDVWRA